MKNFLLLCLLILGTSLQAQLVLSETSPTDTFDLSMMNSDDFSLYTTITNTGPAATFRWKRELVDVNCCWGTAVCVDVTCYSASQDSFTFDLEEGESAELILHVYSGGLPFVELANRKEGETTVDLRVFEIDDPDNEVTVTYHMMITSDDDVPCSIDDTTCLTNVSEAVAAAQNIQIFPNPTNAEFSITTNDIVNEIIIYDLMGRPVKTFTTATPTYSIESLANGVYWVSFVHEEYGIIQTKKLIKNQ